MSSPKNGVTEQGRRIGEYSALPDNEIKLRRGYMAPRQYRLKKGHVEYRRRNVRTKKLKIFIIDIVDLCPIAETVNFVAKNRTHILLYTRPGLLRTG